MGSEPHRGDAIAGHLRLIRSSWDHMLPTGPRVGGGSEPVKGSKVPPPPVPIGIVSLRREACEVLVSWCRLILEDVVDVNGDRMTVELDGRDGPAMAGWLLTWADFLGEHDAARLADDELGHIAKRCDDVVAERQVRRFKVGPCIDHGTSDMGERTPCPGMLVAFLSTDDDLLPARLSCNVDPDHTYAASDWRRLGDRIHSADLILERHVDLVRKILGT